MVPTFQPYARQPGLADIYLQNSEMMNHNVQRAIIAEILFMKNLIGHSPIYVSVSWAETLIGKPIQKIWDYDLSELIIRILGLVVPGSVDC